MFKFRAATAAFTAALLAGCAGVPATMDQNQPALADAGDAPGTAHPEIWPAYEYPVPTNPQTEQRIADLLNRMTLEEKIGQLVQADLCCVTPEDVQPLQSRLDPCRRQ